jgi:hypothetical protein
MTDGSPDLPLRIHPVEGSAMIRPAERFPVNIPPPATATNAPRPLSWSVSMPVMLIAAAIVGAGIGGTIPSGRALFHPSDTTLQTAWGSAVEMAAIEPAAGPTVSSGANPALVLLTRAPDGAFYATAASDRVPLTMRLGPSRSDSVLAPGDAARLVPGGVAQMTVRVAELALHGHVSGPVEQAVAGESVATSVLGADLLQDFTVVEVDPDHLRLVAR